MMVKSERVDGASVKRRRTSTAWCSERVVAVGLGLVVLLGAFLRFYQLGAYSIGNTYYAATVKSMLTSWHNFFFAAFEPGGSVMVDKPPLGFWVQAASAYLLGVNGFALALPQALAGTLSIPLLYKLVRRPFGVGAGLVAALALAVTPVTVATERNNTIDGLLVFVLLLAAWAVWRAVERGQLRYLILGTFLVGLGFNVKMLQAFIPLPALYALYLLGAPHRWWKRLVHLGVATVVLIAVSLAWAVAVDLTPSDARPYVGSSENNTVMELIFGHNGIRRLTSASTGNPSPPARAPNSSGDQSGLAPQFPPPSGGQNPSPPPPGGGRQPPQNPVPRAPGASLSNPITQEVGQAGALRLLSEPLVTEAGWLLPLAALGLPLLLVVLGWRWPLGDRHLALVLWAGWLLPAGAYFSFTSGLFHAYYLIMLGPPLAALVGATAWALGRVWRRRRWLGWAALALLVGVTSAVQIATLQNYPDYAGGVAALAVLAAMVGLGWLAVGGRRPRAAQAAVVTALAGLMVAPLFWSGLTAFDRNPEVWLPRAGAQGNAPDRPTTLTAEQERTLVYLLDHTEPDSYLVATLNAREAAPYILETGRPVLTLGGFSGSDNVVDVDRLAALVVKGELRFVLGGEQLARQKPQIVQWLNNSCAIVTLPGIKSNPSPQRFGPDEPGGPSTLFDCGQTGVLQYE